MLVTEYLCVYTILNTNLQELEYINILICHLINFGFMYFYDN